MRPFERIAIIGLGLIGSSIARAAHQAELAQTIVGCDSNDMSLAFGRKQGFIDVATSSPAQAVENADLVIIATPTRGLEAVLQLIEKSLKPLCMVMDTGSVKQPALTLMKKYLPMNVYAIPAHPIAGSDKLGVSAGRADLFHKKKVIITPEEPLSNELLRSINQFWQAFGARVEGMPADIHDMIYSYVSHLPQLLAFASGQCISPTPVELDHYQILHKFFRLSGSSPNLWANIIALNHENIAVALDRYLDAVAHIIVELRSAPEGEQSGGNVAIARLELFPRIAASCLITTVMEAEKKAGFAFARYCGTGFADFTSPAMSPPDNDIENIAAHYQEVLVILEHYYALLTGWRILIAEANESGLENSFH